jgi:hypothetical protein
MKWKFTPRKNGIDKFHTCHLKIIYFFSPWKLLGVSKSRNETKR